jgi:hypothetical protein
VSCQLGAVLQPKPGGDQSNVVGRTRELARRSHLAENNTSFPRTSSSLFNRGESRPPAWARVAHRGGNGLVLWNTAKAYALYMHSLRARSQYMRRSEGTNTTAFGESELGETRGVARTL